MQTTGVLRGRPLFLAAALLMALVTSAPIADASTPTTTIAPSSLSDCGVAASDLVRVVTTDTPCTVATYVGGSFEIVLRSGWRWGTPTSDSTSVIVSHITKSSMGVASAVLTATSVGVAVIHVAGTIYCAPSKVCPELAMLWTLKVIVTKSATAPLTLHLTSADIHDTYNVRPGDRFIVSLTPVAKYTWSEPNAKESSVVRRISGRAGASANGLFVARRSGRTELVATQKPNCGTGCSSKTIRFWVNVVVTS
ncbi:MAG TPA: hypothetical protein VII60_02515 [Acidimicrobiales bacterium]